jgi:NAD(P)-dependent dehydrogenase (short-subunit alcohol dehydrogenase family)
VMSLGEQVALVTGASRGVGKGVAIALGEAGATVFVTGRSTRAGGPTGSLPGTVEETAEAVTAAGGTGIPVPCDHMVDEQTRAVFDRIAEESRELDVLVNSAWSGYEHLHAGEHEVFAKLFWEQPAAMWDEMSAGTRAGYVASAFAARLMIERRRGLIVNISSFASAGLEPNAALGIAKSTTDKLTETTAAQLRDHGVAVVSLYPGLVRTEGILKWSEFIDLGNSESPQFVGRAVAALAADPDVLDRSGQVLVAAELAEEYGFVDLDGARPASLRSQYEVES